jgi:hypothetical protein
MANRVHTTHSIFRLKNEGKAYYNGSMTWAHKATHSASTLSHRLLSYLSQDWIPILLDLYRSLREVLTRESHEGMYEILGYDTTPELIDPKGEIAIFKRCRGKTLTSSAP